MTRIWLIEFGLFFCNDRSVLSRRVEKEVASKWFRLERAISLFARAFLHECSLQTFRPLQYDADGEEMSRPPFRTFRPLLS